MEMWLVYTDLRKKPKDIDQIYYDYTISVYTYRNKEEYIYKY